MQTHVDACENMTTKIIIHCDMAMMKHVRKLESHLIIFCVCWRWYVRFFFLVVVTLPCYRHFRLYFRWSTSSMSCRRYDIHSVSKIGDESITHLLVFHMRLIEQNVFRSFAISANSRGSFVSVENIYKFTARSTRI